MAIGFSNRTSRFTCPKNGSIVSWETLELPEVLSTDRDHISEYAKTFSPEATWPEARWVVRANE